MGTLPLLTNDCQMSVYIVHHTWNHYIETHGGKSHINYVTVDSRVRVRISKRYLVSGF